jgi:hypothetical protein
MRRGQLGLAVRELNKQLVLLHDVVVTSAGEPDLMQRAQAELDQLRQDRQWLGDELAALERAPTHAFAANAGWGDDIPAAFAKFDKQLDALQAHVERLQR